MSFGMSRFKTGLVYTGVAAVAILSGVGLRKIHDSLQPEPQPQPDSQPALAAPAAPVVRDALFAPGKDVYINWKGGLHGRVLSDRVAGGSEPRCADPQTLPVQIYLRSGEGFDYENEGRYGEDCWPIASLRVSGLLPKPRYLAALPYEPNGIVGLRIFEGDPAHGYRWMLHTGQLVSNDGGIVVFDSETSDHGHIGRFAFSLKSLELE